MEAEARERINAIKTDVRQSIMDPQGMAGVLSSENPNVESTVDALAGLCGGDDDPRPVVGMRYKIMEPSMSRVYITNEGWGQMHWMNRLQWRQPADMTVLRPDDVLEAMGSRPMMAD
jgi:hypothetical protein